MILHNLRQYLHKRYGRKKNVNKHMVDTKILILSAVGIVSRAYVYDMYGSNDPSAISADGRLPMTLRRVKK